MRAKALLAVAGMLALSAVAWAPAAIAGDGDDPEARVVITGGADIRDDETVGDLVVIDGDVDVDGTVDGDLVAVAGDVSVSGEVTGDLVTVAGRAKLARGALVGGDLSYGDERPIVAPGAEVEGDITNENLDDIGAAPWAVIGTVALWIAMTLSLLVLGVCLIAMVPRVAEATAAVSRESLWESVGIGIASWIALGVLGVFALFTLVGIPLGLILLSAVIPTAALGYLAASFALGRRVAGSASPILAFLAGFAILRALALIPFLGALVSLLAATVGIGLLVVAASRAGATGRRTTAASAAKPKPAAKKKAPAKKAAAKKRAAKKPAARRPRSS
jgi:cytoskeletal protein CcmA (bactofilin family)